jgi:hypothetical protein
MVRMNGDKDCDYEIENLEKKLLTENKINNSATIASEVV